MTTSSASESGDLRVEATQEGSVVRVLAIEVAAERVAAATDRAYAGLARSARVSGFRRGKVPKTVLERMYGASVREEVGQRLVSETLGDALELAGVEPVVEPDVEVPVAVAGEPLRYSARVEVAPEIALPELSGLPARRPALTVPDRLVDEQLEELRLRNAPLLEEPEDTAAARGHHLRMNYEGRIDGQAFEGGSAKDVDIELGSGRLIPGFEDQLVGARAGEDREVRVTFPDDYAEAQVRGKDAVFAVHVESLRRRELPTLDDEFAKDLGDFETLDALRARIHADLTAEREREASAALHRSVMDSLIERTDFEVPPGLVQRQLERQVEAMERQFRGQIAEPVLRAQLERMREEGRPVALRRVRERLLLEAVVKAQGIEVDDADVDARLDSLAEGHAGEAGRLRQVAREQGWADSIRAELASERALDFVASRAKVEENTDT